MNPTTLDLKNYIVKTKRCPDCGTEFEATFPCPLAKDGSPFYELFKKPEAYCKNCCDAADARAREKEAADAKAARAAARQKKWNEMVPPIFAETTISLLPEIARRNMSKVAEWRVGSQGLLLMGPTRRGKTRLMWLLAERLYVDEGRKIQFKTAAQFSHECSRAFSNGGEGADWSDRMINCDVFLLDDLGKGRMTDRTQTELFGILDARMSYKRPVVISMNHDGESLSASLSQDIGPALVGRLREICEVVSFE